MDLCKYASVYIYLSLCTESVCLAVYVANGHIMAFSLPSLKPLLDSDFLPFPDIRSAALHLACVCICCSGVKLSSPTLGLVGG